MGKTLDDLFSKLEQMEQGIYQRLDRLDERMDGLETRMDRLEERMDGLESRMDRLEERMDSLEARMDRVETRLDAHDTRFDHFEEMVATFIQMSGQNNTQWKEAGSHLVQLDEQILDVSKRYDELNADVLELKEQNTRQQAEYLFLDKKAWQHEKQLFLLARQMRVDVEVALD